MYKRLTGSARACAGVVSKPEFEAYMNQNGGTMSSAQTDCVFDNGDTDSNGELSAIELINLNEAMVNGDQSVFDGCYDASGGTPECGWASTPCANPPDNANGQPDYTMCFADSASDPAGSCDGKRGSGM